MFKSDNFISFLTVVGFFIGLTFAVLHGFEPDKFLYSVLIISGLFYILGLASSSFFIKYISVKKIFELDKDILEKTIDMQIFELDKKEDFIREAHYFIKDIEKEEKSLYKKEDNKR
jgi:hypothetical protein